METLHDIISIEKVYLDKDGDIVVEAILENMGSETHPQTLYDMPEYAPALCKTTIYKEGVPPGITLEDNEQILERIVNRYNLLVHQTWEPIIVDDSDKYWDGYKPSDSRLFF